ncbi:hypothetical protein [Bosea sp. (in: a-proteobacteria)]|uniref:hypothetical protein n=1 Tax=Bosea sp. (in: a-proteobacteria) TaxID=1871050 RepID=UPI002B4708A5|nr:hypothetical protein [Bosea sp. (in: a-proteobacteria)]WRH59163.1 MAG: hypothetical protein RSE11_05080 [Bosea sp. (in: a-proteobacteria)]
MKSNSMHPADAADAMRVASAVCYVATIFVGTGRFDRASHATLAEARVTARAMEAHYRNGRRAMIYGVLPCGATVLMAGRI